MNTFARGATAAALLTLASLSAAHANSVIYAISADGIKEVNSSGVSNGDPDGLALGIVKLDNGTGSGNTGSALISLQLSNIAYPLAGFHIHNAPATTTGPIVLDFGAANNFRTGDTLLANVSGLSSTTINNIFANPTNFYFNLHNQPFPGGAVRQQLGTVVPEPGSIALLCGMGLMSGMLLRRKTK